MQTAADKTYTLYFFRAVNNITPAAETDIANGAKLFPQSAENSKSPKRKDNPHQANLRVTGAPHISRSACRPAEISSCKHMKMNMKNALSRTFSAV